jgi:AraC-like DNA-binding protein
MEGHARTWFTPKQRAELWERWKSGQCVADIARALERRNKSGVYRVLALKGGIAPLPRRRAQRALRLAEREEISRGIAAGWSMRRIAQNLGRSPSTVSREIRRNGGCSAYRASWLIGLPGSDRCARSPVAWRAMPSYDGRSRRSSRCSGRRSRSPAG